MENQLTPRLESSSEESDRIIIRRKTIKDDLETTIIDVECGFDDLTRPRQMHKVLPQLTLKKHPIEHVYDPVIVSLGPYHHESLKLGKAEEFKTLCVRWLAFGNKVMENTLYSKIMANIEAIRSSYAESSVLEQYDDGALALMMLRDASFIVSYMAMETRMERNNISDWESKLGLAAYPLMLRDIMKLENQVPFLVIKLLIGLQQGEEWGRLLHRFLIWLLVRDGSQERVRIPREHEDPPLHLLEAVWRAITESEEDEPVKLKISQHSQFGSRIWQKLPRLLSIKRKNEGVLYHSQRMFRSVMDLKAKGIYFSPTSHSLKVVRFRSFSYYGELQLPVRYVSDQHQVILSNLIAYEVSPGSDTDQTVLSYTILMKSLIESPEDVKELQKRGILFNKYSNHEQVVKSFKEIDTLGLVNLDVFGDVKEKIGEHCRNRAKTWTADLIHTRLQSPWSIMTVCAATFLLCLTTLQTFYAIHHPK